MIANGYAKPMMGSEWPTLKLFTSDELNNVTHLDLSTDYFGEKEALALCQFIVSDRCKLKRLNLISNSLAHRYPETFLLIADAMAQNKTIVQLDLGYNMYRHHSNQTFN